MNPPRTTQHLAQQVHQELPHFRSPRMFSPIALAAFNMAAMRIHENPLHTPQPTTTREIDIKHLCAPIIHPITGEHITNYMKLKNNPCYKSNGGQHLDRNLMDLHKKTI